MVWAAGVVWQGSAFAAEAQVEGSSEAEKGARPPNSLF